MNMNTIKFAVNLWILLASALILHNCESSEKKPDYQSTQNTVVVLKFKAQPEMGLKAISELNKLIEKVKQEPNFIEIKLHVDPKDNTNILLYEKWEDENYYNSEHMETEHIKAFMADSRTFLSGPPDITFWKVEKIFR